MPTAGACEENDTRASTCAEGYENGTDTCTDGTWTQSQACTPIPDCIDGTNLVPCGLNGRGTQSERCEDGEVVETSACDDPDSCEDDLTDTTSCGFNEMGSQALTCVEGQWVREDFCDDPRRMSRRRRA